MKHGTRSIWLLILTVLALAACTSKQNGVTQQADENADKDIVQTAIAAGDFTTLVTALKAADLVDTLEGPGPFTVFAPTDEAFAALPEGTLDDLLADKDRLVEVLTYHVIPGKVTAKDIKKMKEAKTLEGEMLEIDTADGVKVGTAKVTRADIITSNGVIHVIDAVLIPEGDQG